MARLHSFALKTGALLVALTAVAAAQDYPTKPVRLIIPFPPGGSNDVVGRMIATQLSEKLGKQVVVDNRAGAGGVIGTEIAANAPPDGYTLLDHLARPRGQSRGSTSSTTIRSNPSRRSASWRPGRTCSWSIPACR